MIQKIKWLVKPLIPASLRLRLRQFYQAMRKSIESWQASRERKKARKINRRKYEPEILAQRAKLHLGCGDDYREGFINVDFFNKRLADKNWKLNDLKLPDGSCERIESYAVMEHLNYAEFYECLEECHRVLVPGGTLIFEIPEFEEYMRHWLAQDYQTRWSFEWFSPIWGGQWNDGQYHKAGYSFERVKEILGEIGFDSIGKKEPSRAYPPCIMQRVEAIKRKLSPQEETEKMKKRKALFENWNHMHSALKIEKVLKKRERKGDGST